MAFLVIGDTFGNVTIYSQRDEVATDGKKMYLQEDSGVSYSIKRPLAYNEFIKRINNQTSIPIKVIHDAMCTLAEEKTVLPEHINEYSATNIIRSFYRLANSRNTDQISLCLLDLTCY